jgi:glycosyltransferase 2 family protein
MKRNLRIFFSYLITISVSLLLLWWALRGINPAKLAEQFRRADYTWLGVSAVLGIMSHWIRARRWRMLLAPLGYQVSDFKSFLAVMSGYFMNFVIPRAGELARCGLIQKLERVPVTTALGTVITERIIDVFILLGLVVVLVLVEFEALSSNIWFFLQSKLMLTPFVIGTLVVICVLGLGVLYWVWRNWGLLLQSNFGRKIEKFLHELMQGVLSLRKVNNLSLFILYSLLIWFLYFLMAYVLFFCFPETAHLDLWFGYIVLVMGTIGMSAPVQGGVGAYHLLVGEVFALRNMTSAQGIILATFMHTAQAVIVLSVGGITMIVGLLWKNTQTVSSSSLGK